MPRPRKYANDAEKQRAYRTRREVEYRNTPRKALLRNTEVTRPALRWLGGKWRIAEWIISIFPPHTCYVEPFGGGANVLLRKPPSRLEVYNDLDADIVNFFAVLRSQCSELVRQIELTPFARDELLMALESTTDSIERARRFYVKCWQSFQPASDPGRIPTWRFQKDWARGKSTLDEWNTVSHLESIASRFKAVQIENRSAEEVIRRFDTPKTLFYVDPPYVPDTRSTSHPARYKHEMSAADHVHLAEALHSVVGMVIVSGYKSDLYTSLYGGWTRLSKSTTTQGNSTSVEYLWLSPKATELGRMPLFAARAATQE